MQNAVGIFAAGGLGGALYLQKQEQEKLESEKKADLAASQSKIDGLSSQVWSLHCQYFLPQAKAHARM